MYFCAYVVVLHRQLYSLIINYFLKHFSLERYSQMYELREKGKVLIRIVFTVQNEDVILLTSFIKRQPRDTMKALDQSLYILSDIQQHPDRTSNFDFQREATA